MKDRPKRSSERQPGLQQGCCRCLSSLLLLGSVVFFLTAARAQTGTPREYELKAVWLYNLLKFVDWPSDVLSPQSEAFTIGILGESQFGEALDRLREKTIKGKKILVKHLAGPSDGRDCQIIFICVSEKERLPQILETLKRTRVLTVGEPAGFAEEGGIANLLAERNRVRLEINNSAASRSGLTISSQLLNVATLKDS